MENLSHSRPPSKTSHASVAKRGCNGGKFAGKTVYEDVFGGPPKFGVPTLSPRPEDYSEIFGGFHASRATSIPVLDLPLVDEEEVFFDVRGCGFDYREVFGGVDGLDFATSFEELIREANGGGDPHDCDGDVEGDSSEEAWTPVETESLSGESDRSGQNQQSSNGDSYEPIDSSLEFSISYHRANHQSNGCLSNGVTRIAEPHLPEYTCVVDNSRPVKKTEIKNLPVYVCDDGSLDFTGRTMQEKHLQKAVSNPAKRIADPRPFGDSFELHRSYGKVSSPDDEMFVTISEISLRTHPSEVPPPRRPPPFLNGKSKDYENSQTTGSGGTSNNSSPPYFDVEIDAGSAAAASAAAMEEAMEKARAKMKSAKERMERKREGCQNGIKLGSKRDAKEKREKSTKVVDGSNNAKDERMLGTSRKEDIAMKPTIRQEGQEVTKITEAVSNPLEREKPFSMAKMSAEEKRGKQSLPSQGTDKTNLVDEWQEATQFFELVRTDDSKMAFVKEDNYSFSIDFENTKRKEHQLNAEKATKEALQQQENNQCREEAVREDHELDKVLKNLRTAKEACERGGNTARSEAAKGVHKRKEHEKKVKVAQAGGKPEENEVKSRIIQPSENGKKSARVEGSQKFDKQVIGKQEENEVKSRNIQPSDNVKKSARVEGSQKLEKQVIGKQEENEVKSRIVQPSENGKKSVWEEGSQKLEKQVNGKQEENEVKSRIDQPPENGKNSAGVEGSPKLELVYDQEFQIKSEVQLAVNDKKLEQKERETSINMENQERIMECQETKDGGCRQREVSERDENDINIMLCAEQTDDVKSMEGAYGQEDREDNSLLQTCELEDNGKKEEADELDEGEMIWRMALEQLEKETRRKQALEQEETRQKERKTYAKEESEKVSEQLLEQANNEKMQKGVFETEVIAKRVERKRWNQEKDGTKKLLEEAFELEESRRAFKDAWDGKDEMQREHSMEKKECEELREVNEVLWQTEDETGGEVLIDAGAHQHMECEDHLVSDEVNRLDSHVKHEFSRTDESFDDQEEVREPISVEDSRSVEDEDTDCESLEAKEEENLHWKFGFSGMNQDELEHAASNLRTEEVTRLDHQDDGVKKTDEAGISIGQRNAEAMKRFSRMESDNEKLGMAEKAENANEFKAASKPEEDKDRFLSPPVVKESAETGRKIEAVKSTLLGARGDTLRTAQPAKTNQSTEKKDKDANLTAREKEFERLKRERELEIERLGKMEEERDREREREKDRMGVDRVTLEARETAYAEVRERAERSALERATAEARQRATAEARERLEKASVEARLRAERAAVERATTEARERAFEKARAERAAFEARQRIERSVSDKFSTFSRNSGMGTSSSSSDLQNQQYKTTGSFNDSRNTSDYNGVEGESAQRCKARLERYRRTAERAAKALADKNTRDLLAQREQAERNRLAETLDADVRRWSSGKEGNLRALLSTLQYILGSDSGWQPVPLTEVITSAAVKKAYRKATLCVHPDKLQQRGASIHQKYICEKVFDLLKEAWNKFNSEER